MINRLEIAGKEFLLHLVDFLFLPLDQLFHFHLFLHRPIEPVDAGDIGAIVEAERRIIAQKTRDGGGVSVVEDERRLVRRAGIGCDLELRARHRLLDAGLDLLERLHR